MNNDASIKILLNALDVGVILTGPDNKVIFMNDFLKNYLNIYSFLDTKITDLFEVIYENKQLDSNIICGFPDAQTNGIIFEKEPLILGTKQNNTKIVSIKTFKDEVLFQNGITSMILIKDIEEKVELEKMKVDFSSQAVHILRTPLTVIRDNLGLFVRSSGYEKLSDSERKNIEEINFELGQLKKLIQNLITVNQIENEKVELQFTNTGIIQIVDQSLKELDSIIKKTNNSVLVIPPLYNLPDIKLDVLKMVSVIKGIVTNSLLHSNQKEIQIKISKDEKFILLEIEDKGEGISELGLRFIFNKFYHSKKNPLLMEQGLGIGLYYCKKIIELHQGNISISSKEGEGTKVLIKLPL